MGKESSHHDTTKPEALATPIPVGSAALCDWEDGKAAGYGGWIGYADGYHYLLACEDHRHLVGGVRSDRFPYRSPDPGIRKHTGGQSKVRSGLGDAYVKLWHAYQTLAIAFHDSTRRFEADITELRLLLRAGSPRG